MIIPDRNPGKLLVTEQKVEIRTVSGEPLTVVIQSVDGSIGQWDTTNALAPTVVTILVFVNIIAEKNNIVH